MARCSGESRAGGAPGWALTCVSRPMSGSSPAVRPAVMTNGRSVVVCSPTCGGGGGGAGGGAASWYALGSLNRVIIDMADGYLLVTAISAGSVLGVIADRSANLGTLAYEMTLFATRAGGALSPRLIAELKNAVQQ